MNLYLVFSITLLLVLCVCYKFKTSHAFRYKFKYLTLLSLVMATGVVAFPFLLLRPREADNIRIVAKVWTVLFQIWGMTYELRNPEYLKSDKPYIVLCNHQSAVDLIAMMKFLPYRCTALAKKSLMYFGPFGISSWLCGLVFVDRLNREKARETMNETAQLLHEKNIKLWVFPEGTRNMEGNLLPFKKGAFHLAVQAQVPIVPVVLSTYRYFISKKYQYFNPGHVIVTALPPISTEGLTSEDVNQLADKAYNAMKTVFEETSAEITELARKTGQTDVLNLIDKEKTD